MSQFLETIRLYNGEFSALEYHQERVCKTFSAFYPKENPFDLNIELHSKNIPANGLYKCRIIYDSQIRKLEFIPYQLPIIRSLKLVQSNISTTHYKSASRDELNAAFSLRESCDDVLLIKNSLLTDTSFCNIALFDGTEWLTPKTPLLYGSMRARLLNDGFLKEADIRVEDLKCYNRISLFNAMIDIEQIDIKISATTIVL